MMRKCLCLLLICTLLVLTGCYDAVDLGERIFAINLALDTGESNALRLTLQYPQITPTGSENAQKDSKLQKNGYVIEQVEGNDLHTCLELMRIVTPRQISLMQLRGLFISDALAKDRTLLSASLTALSDAYSARPTALVHITRGRAEEVLMQQSPLFGARLSKSQSAQNNALLAQGVIPSAPLNLFYQHLFDPAHSAMAVLTAINPMKSMDSPKSADSQPTAYFAGELPRNTEDAVDLCGSAVFGENELVYLNGYETQLINLLTGYLRKMDLTVSGSTVTLEIVRTPDISVKLDGSNALIRVRLPIRYEKADAARYTEQLKQDVTSLLLNLQQHHLDPVGIADRARIHAQTIEAWQQMDWPALYSSACFDVDIY